MRPVGKSVGVSFPYGVKYSRGGTHKGVDFSRGREGDAVYSSLDGVVTHAGFGGWGRAFGQHVVIKSTLNKKTRWMLYGHMKTESVYVGQRVKAGQKIGTIGGRKGATYSGNSTGPHVHVQLGWANRYDRYLNPAAAFAWQPPKATESKDTAKWFGVLAWNLAAFDGEHGRASWKTRVPAIIAAIKHYDRDIGLFCEVASGKNLENFKLELAKIGHKVVVYDNGRCVIARDNMRVGRTKIVELAERGPSNDDKQIVLAEVFPRGGTTAVLVEAGHFEYRNGWAYDKVRVTQARQTRAVIESTMKEWGIHPTRVVAYNDENSKSLTNAAWGTTWRDIKNAAPFYGNGKYSTLIGWNGKPSTNGYRPDKVRTHKSRPMLGGSTSLTFAGRKVSNHLPIVCTVGTF